MNIFLSDSYNLTWSRTWWLQNKQICVPNQQKQYEGIWKHYFTFVDWFWMDTYISRRQKIRLFKNCNRPLFPWSLLGYQQGTLAAHYTSAPPVAATNTNQVLSETDFLRQCCRGAQYHSENNNGMQSGAACSPDSELLWIVILKVKHLACCLVFFTRWNKI